MRGLFLSCLWAFFWGYRTRENVDIALLNIDTKRKWMICQQSDTHIMRKELWDRQGANIASR